MRVTCISDTHNRHQYIDLKEFKYTDILIHAGDFSNGNKKQTESFLEWFNSLEIKHKILVAGNHDFYCTSSEIEGVLSKYPSITYLHNSSVTVNNLKIWGSPYSNRFGHWAFMEEEYDLEAIWEKIPTDTDIVITHGPAYGSADRVVNNMYDRDPHVGSETLRLKLESLPNLKAHICGHIHEGYGIYQGKFLTIGASICDENYIPCNKPITFNIKDPK